LPQPSVDPVPTGNRLAHHPFIPTLDLPQVAEGGCGYAGSNKGFSVERDSVRKEQLLEPLFLRQTGVNPHVRGIRQYLLSKRENALDVELISFCGQPISIDGSVS
jgi:hypothetical protein